MFLEANCDENDICYDWHSLCCLNRCWRQDFETRAATRIHEEFHSEPDSQHLVMEQGENRGFMPRFSLLSAGFRRRFLSAHDGLLQLCALTR